MELSDATEKIPSDTTGDIFMNIIDFCSENIIKQRKGTALA
jgi:hypothetical protein